MALEGTLQDMSLGDLFQVFRMGPKTGVLLLTGGPERGVIYVVAGRLTDAAVVRCADRLVLTAQDEAVIQMLLWEDASFVFRHDTTVVSRPARIRNDSEWLVMEGMRRRDDPTRALPYHRLTLETQLQLAPLPTTAESGVSLDVNQWRILSQVSNCLNLRAICEATGIAPVQAIRIVAELLSIGLVEIVPPARPVPAPASVREPDEHSVRQLNQVLVGGLPASAPGGENNAQPVGRSLLDAIMRRIRGL